MDIQPKIIAVVGLAGAGKTEVTARFIERGFVRVGFNDVYNEEFDKRGIKRGDELGERKVREELRREFGMDFAAQKALPKIEVAFIRKQNVVVESLYSWEEYTFMKERFGSQFRVMAVYAPPDVRYERLAIRSARSFTLNRARSRDYAQITNLHQAGPIAMADWTILNTSIKKDLVEAVDKVIKNLVL